MKVYPTPELDTRDAVKILFELLARRPAYVPEMEPQQGRPAYGLFQIFSQYMQAIIHTLNQAPDKNLMAFLDMLGVSLIPAQGARGPVVFQSRPTSPDGRIVKGTRLGADSSTAAAPVLFETEHTVALASASLAQIVSLWPARDTYVDHSSDLNGSRPFTLFRNGQKIDHELYVSHDTVLAFHGKSTIQIEFEFAVAGSVPLSIVWEFWDGQAWRGFRAFDRDDPTASQDGTSGLTRSGVVTLRAECGDSAKTTINGVNAYWIRGCGEHPLPPDPARVFASADRIRLRSVLERPLQESGNPLRCVGGLAPDQAFADSTQLDLTSTFFPFGKSPDNQSIFYLTSQEVFSKPGALATLCFSRTLTPEQDADLKSSDYELKVAEAVKLVVSAATNAANSVLDAARSIMDFVDLTFDATDVKAKITDLANAVNSFNDFHQIGSLAQTSQQLVDALGSVKMAFPVDTGFGGFHFPFDFGAVQASVLAGDINALQGHALQTAQDSQSVLNSLSQLDPIHAAAVGGALPPQLAPATLAWEYWDGGAWQTLAVGGSDLAINLRGQGPNDTQSNHFTFQVPENWSPLDVNGVTGRWMRARIANGSFNHLRLVSWYDTLTKNLNFFPILEPRPPALNQLLLGYTFRPKWQFPEQCVTRNDFLFEVHTRDARTPGNFFAPFRPTSDALPALYLGFDKPLPNDNVSLFFDLKEVDEVPPALVWEVWNGTAWQALSVTDQTDSLSGPGFVSFVPPEIPPRPQASVIEASANRILTGGVEQSARFRRGDRIVIRQDKAYELGIVEKIEDALLFLETPLRTVYSGGSVQLAALPRFGTPLDWVRARLKKDGAPLESQVKDVFLNAVSVAQVRTITGEILGSGNAQLDQTVFFREAPILPGEVIEVRELEGARANVEFLILRDKLLRGGFPEDAFRVISDSRTGKVTEVWVQWQSRPNLFFSSPEDRHYVIERARGRVIFGDGINGCMPTVGTNNIRGSWFQTTDGTAGNVPGGTITKLMAGATSAASVSNPVAANAGVDGESIAEVRWRGPQTVRHQDRSLAARDYEALAREASPGVAQVKALPAKASNLRPAPGCVTLIVVPKSTEPEPLPSRTMRQEIHDYLILRTPATLACSHLSIIGPKYLPVGVQARVKPRVPEEAGDVKSRVLAALGAFLHPVTGGPDGGGWPFGRDIYMSDVSSVLAGISGIDSVEDLELLSADVPVGEHVSVSVDRVVSAGPLRIEMKIGAGDPCHCH